ncbi:MAG: universal stress protein [Flavobacteriales bacterium]
MKKILVPTDFSKYSIYAAEMAARIAKKTDARIFFLHVINFPMYEGNLPFQEYKNVAENLFIMKHVRQKFQELFQQPFLKNVNIAEAVSFDGVYESITEQAQKNEIDLIVMGTHGASGLMGNVLGSNTEKVVRLSKIPVITVKNKPVEVDFEKIIFACDFSEDIDTAFTKILDFSKIFNSTIELLRVVTIGNFQTTSEAEEQLQTFAEKMKLSNYSTHVYNADNVDEGIIEFGRKTEAGILATANHGKSGFAQLFNSSVTRELVNNSPYPVLTVQI